ncbi:MAG: DUF342 domain-containing protein [Bacillota bacterium]
MKKVLKIEAKDKSEAISLAKKEFEKLLKKDKLDKRNISIRVIEEKKGFFLFKNSKKVYEIVYDDSISKADEQFLELAMDSIDIDGEFKLKVIDDGIFLKVSQPQGEGKKINYSDVKVVLEEKEIVEVDWQSVREALEDTKEKWQLIAPRKKELDREAELRVKITADKLKAYLSYSPSLGGKKLVVKDIKNFLSEEGIVYGIKEDKIKEIIKNRQKVEDLLIAEGIEPVPGKDARLIFHFEDKKESIGTKRDDGSMDYFNLGLITNVEPGDILVTKEDPVAGKAGTGVDGEKIEPSNPKDVKLPRGKNTEIKDDYTLVARGAGQVVVNDRDKVEVLPIYEIKGDVDLSTGNIDFVGNVKVNGNITEGFKVRADGNVEVRGNVSIANIEAGGNVIIQHGFIGKNKSVIKAKGDVKVKFVENASIITEKNIYVADAVMHSKLTAGDSIEVVEKKGLLVGGISKAGKKIIANIIGSSLATTTQLEAGVDPEIKAKLRELQEEIKGIQSNLTKSLKAIRILEQLKESQNGLPEEKVIMYYQLQKTEKQLQKVLEDKERNIEEIRAKLDVSQNGYIQAKKKLYPGVKIIIGNAQMNIHNEIPAVKFLEQEGEITQLSIGW